MSDRNWGGFSDLADTDTGKRLWEFLNSDDSLIRLETATYLKRPALEGLQPQMLAEFGEDFRGDLGDRWKRLAGRMVRRILEDKGYQLDSMGVKVRVNEGLFTTAARYKRAMGRSS